MNAFLTTTADSILHLPAGTSTIRPLGGIKRFVVDVPEGTLHDSTHFMQMTNAIRVSKYSDLVSFYGFTTSKQRY